MNRMVHLTLLLLLATGALRAQGTFRIFDAQMNDVTSGILYIPDTNATMIQVDLTVENTDSVAHDVTAGRLVLTQPVTASNAFTWGQINYPPAADSSGLPENMSPAATEPFEGYYFPNSNGGTCTINYCFWETTDMNNNSCVTVTYDNIFPAGTAGPIASPAISYGPNPAGETFGVGWYNYSFVRANLYNSQGQLMRSDAIESRQSEYIIDLAELPPGIYFLQMVEANGSIFNSTIVH